MTTSKSRACICGMEVIVTTKQLYIVLMVAIAVRFADSWFPAISNFSFPLICGRIGVSILAWPWTRHPHLTKHYWKSRLNSGGSFVAMPSNVCTGFFLQSPSRSTRLVSPRNMRFWNMCEFLCSNEYSQNLESKRVCTEAVFIFLGGNVYYTSILEKAKEPRSK